MSDPFLNVARERLDSSEPIPAHLVCARSRAEWHRAVESHPDTASRRADWRRGLMAVVWQLATRTGRNMVTAPKKGATWAVMAAEAGVSRSTLADRLAWLLERGLLVRVTPGTTPRFRPGTLRGALDDGRGNEAATYVLTVPADLAQALDEDDQGDGEEFRARASAPTVDDWRDAPWPAETLPVELTRTPKPHVVDVGEETFPDVRARETPAPAAPVAAWPAAATPGTKAEMLAACERLRAEDPILRKMSARHLRSLLRRLFQLGATVDDVRHVLHHQPGGGAWPLAAAPRFVPGWVRWRVHAWLTPDSSPDGEGIRLSSPLPSQVREAYRRRIRCEQTARTTALAEARTCRGDAAAGAALARQHLMAALSRAPQRAA
ncbi:hypothetical protein AAH991_36440 [Microbispora sp. ZYX-F-249]|uniref:Helix-turn-helix domain-containing protein n=1 Tax=Microbispora maris TaxID=3144104 RepID=A0ABV0B1I6_9ACTN